MSKIGKMPIRLVENVQVTLNDVLLIVKGPLGELSWDLPKPIEFKQENNVITLANQNPESPEARALHGLARAKLANMVKGVADGFERILEINGVGFKAEVKDKTIVLNVGFSHPVELNIPEGVEIKVTKNEITVSGIDKEVVGEMAAKIRATKKPEPYKGKGIKYKEEVIKRKQGKAAKTAA
ncbi:MAG: 50S ribosomal protein L6 [Patescibacteria group bacterium]|nr:50S ribosomal protein L6 [Patescibacteria group bacterium]